MTSALRFLRSVRNATGVIKPVLPVIFAAQLVCSAEEAVYFLLGPQPGFSAPMESVVIPISLPQDIQHARDVIVKGQAAGSTMAGAYVDCGKNGINRNYLDPTFPEWSWHVVQFNGFPDLCAEGEMLSAGELELLFHGCEKTGTNGLPYTPFPVCFAGYTVVRELGSAPLAISAVPDGQNLQLYWSAPGTNYAFTLEGSELPAGTNWFAIPGVSWPLATNHWSVPGTSSRMFYRVMAAPRSSGEVLDENP